MAESGGAANEGESRRLRRSAILGGAIVLCSLVATGALFERFVADEQAALDELRDATALHRLLDETLRLTVDAETAQRGYVLTGDEAFLAPLHGARAHLSSSLEAVGGLLASKHEDAAARGLREAVDARAAWTEETVSMAEHGDLAGARARIATREGMRLTDQVRDLARAIGEREDQHVEILEARVDRSRGRLRAAFIAVVSIAIVLLTVLSRVLDREIRQLRARSEQAQRSERRFRSIAESASDLVRSHRMDGTVDYVSPSCERLLGYTPAEILARPAFSFLPEDDRVRVRALLDRMFETRASAQPIRHGLVHRHGHVRQFETHVDLALDEEGRIVGYHTIGRDVTERALEEERMNARATKDALTGLTNAGAFAVDAAAVLARCEREGRLALLAFCDVNGLKVINDTLGHDAGDGVIVDAATLLRTSARDSDLVARLGGDEFVVLGIVQGEQGAQVFAERLAERVRAHNGAAGRAYRVSISVGTAIFRPGTGTTLETLRAEADAAMYRQKRGRRGEPTTVSGELLVRERSPS